MHVHIHVHAHTHTPLPPTQIRACQRDSEGLCFLFYHHELMNFNISGVIQSIVSLLFNAQIDRLWPVGASSDCLLSPL